MLRRTLRARLLVALAVLAVVASPLALPLGAALPPRALELRDLGFAELENEKPERAEAAYRELAALLPGDPLPQANLAIACLRQQKPEEARAAIDRALALAPGRGDLLAIDAEVRQWSGDLDGALASYEKAAAAAPDDPEIVYGAYQVATTLRTPEASALAKRLLVRLIANRPENVVVMLQVGQAAIAAGQRATATQAYGRLGELVWQEGEVVGRALAAVEEALASGELEKARVPAARLENVLKISPMFRESLRELKTGIQGVPVERFEGEPAGDDGFGPPLAVSFEATRIDPRPSRAVAVGDLDGDEKPDLVALRSDGVLELRRGDGGYQKAAPLAAPPGLETLVLADLDNDADLDLVALGVAGAAWRNDGHGAFTRVAGDLGLAAASGRAAAVVDFDIEGDLDLATAGAAGVDLFRNPGEGALERVGERVFGAAPALDASAVVASDLDADGDLDLVVGHAGGATRFDNLRQGQLRGSPVAGVAAEVTSLAARDLDGDGVVDLAIAGRGLSVRRGPLHLGPIKAPPTTGLTSDGDWSAVVAFDADLDGRPDLAAAGVRGVAVYGQRSDGGFGPLEVRDGPARAAALIAADLDGDGDLDLVSAGPEGLHRLDNEGPPRHHWLALRLRGLTKGNSKNNVFGVGSRVEVRSGEARQVLEAAGDVLTIGLGTRSTAKVLRVVWTNGVPQNRIDLAGDQRLVEEQLLKGSCPFLYAWDGSRMAFVTDLLWASPLGLPVAPAAWIPPDPRELVRIDGLALDGDRYRLAITEELWEAAFFDQVRLWVVDHPAEVEVASSLRVRPGAGPDGEPRVLGATALRPLAGAWDGRGREVTGRVERRDEVYADGYEKSPYQGVAARPWTFTFDLGAAPAAAVRLLLDGWIFPADASLNLAVAQRGDLEVIAPRLEVESERGWEVLMPAFGHPAGKTKTMVVDTPPLPPGARRLRIVASQWLHWDRIAWTLAPAEERLAVVARLEPSRAELRFRGFSRMTRVAPNGPHGYDYGEVRRESPWLPFPGRYTAYGDVSELLAAADDRSVILAPGDELALEIDAAALPPPAPGFARTLFLESHGWDKDADRNTWQAEHVEPLPFRAMSGYPYGDGEAFPDTPELRAYLRDWLTRVVEP